MYEYIMTLPTWAKVAAVYLVICVVGIAWLNWLADHEGER